MTIVSTMPAAKRVFTALVIATPLTLVACGSGETASDSGSTATAAAGSASTVTSTTAAEAAPKESEAAPEGEEVRESEKPASEESAAPKPEAPEASEKETVAPAGPDAQGANAGVKQTIANPFEEGEQIESVEQEPVQGGAPAGQADADAIKSLVNGIYQQTTLNGLVQYVPNNTCQAVLATSDWDPTLETQGVPDMPLDQIPQFQQAQPSVDSVNNLSVAGDQASAEVTVTSGGQTDTSTMRFLREDGRWKFCSSAV